MTLENPDEMVEKFRVLNQLLKKVRFSVHTGLSIDQTVAITGAEYTTVGIRAEHYRIERKFGFAPFEAQLMNQTTLRH